MKACLLAVRMVCTVTRFREAKRVGSCFELQHQQWLERPGAVRVELVVGSSFGHGQEAIAVVGHARKDPG